MRLGAPDSPSLDRNVNSEPIPGHVSFLCDFVDVLWVVFGSLWGALGSLWAALGFLRAYSTIVSKLDVHF